MPLPDGSFRQREIACRGMRRLSLVLTAVYAGMASLPTYSGRPDERWAILGIALLAAPLLFAFGASRIDLIAGDNFREQHQFFCGLRVRRRRRDATPGTPERS